MALLAIALFGLLVPNGLFLYWLWTEYEGIGAVFHNKLALALMLDALLAVGLLACFFARRPIGKIHWGWFIVLSFVGGLGFSLPLYWWLNQRKIR